MPEITFTLNGGAVTVDVDPKATALDVLRDRLGILTAKAGCSPQGLCGCCTALVEGKPRLTCTLPFRSLAGKAVTTMDGLDEADRTRIAEAFTRAGAAQCGYCTPGIVLSTHALLRADPDPGDEAVARALAPHVCRCTGYVAIGEGIRAAAAAARGEPWPLAPVERPEGREVALGDRPYVDDLERPGMLHGALVFAPAARGVVEEVAFGEGVTGVLLVEPGAEARHAGEPVAAVAAEDGAAARAAAAATRVSLADAPEPGEDVVARGRRTEGGGGGEAAHRAIRVVETAFTDPVFLEPEAALAVPGPDGLVIYSAAEDATSVSRSVGEGVRVVLVPSGGSYGGKVGSPVEVAAARLARETGRPVRVSLSHEEGMRLHPKRPGARVRAEAACDGGGRLVSLAVVADVDGGAACPEADRIVAQALGAVAYEARSLVVDVRVHRSAGPATGAIRGGAGLAVSFAVERALDALAAEVGLDGFELRARNLGEEGSAVLAALRPAWEAAAGAKGVAVARADGSGGARVVLTVTGADAVEVQCNVPELGQGRDETLLRVLRAATGLGGDVFDFAWADGGVAGPGAPAQTPVEGAAFLAGRALAAAGGPLAGHVGRRFVGDDLARAAAGWSAQVAELDAAGALRTLHVAFATGPGQDPRLARNLAEGAAHMGAGVALAEEVAVADGAPETRFRMLGVLKAKASPAVRARAVPLPGGPRDVSEVAVMPTAGAIAAAVQAFDGVERTRLPMKETPAARAAGVRPPKPGA
ncbi:MAG: molybdopterin cofactor-binding domain-containing protein [Myxococcota bacterium]